MRSARPLGSSKDRVEVAVAQKDKANRVSAFVDANGNARDYSSAVPLDNRQDVVLDREQLINNPRYRVLKELKDSERTYLTFLQSVVLLFYSPCKNSTTTSNPILPPHLIDELFGNILDVAEISSQILQAIEVIAHPKTWNHDESTIGDMFFDLLKVRITPMPQ